MNAMVRTSPTPLWLHSAYTINIVLCPWCSRTVSDGAIAWGIYTTSLPAKRILLLSLDGMHALDLANYVKTKPNSTLTQLSQHGITYTNAHTSLPSNSWPGLLAIVTEGSRLSTGSHFLK